MSAQGMPPNLLALFAPRIPLTYLPPVGGYGIKPAYSGLHDFLDKFENDPPPPVEPFETPKEKRERKKKEKLEEHRKKQSEMISQYDPNTSDCATKNPFATLFVGRISYETTEKKLKKEFEVFGPIRRVKVITDFNGKSRGYAFIEYESEGDLKKAYKQGDGKKIDGRRVLVDVERSRTVTQWIPRRLGGGKGPPRFTEPKKKQARGPIAILPPTPPISSSNSYSGRQYSGSGTPWQQSGSRGGGGRSSYGSGKRDDRSGHYGGRPSYGNNRSSRDSNHYGNQNNYHSALSGGNNNGPGSWGNRDEGKNYGASMPINSNGYDRDTRRRSRSRDHELKRYRSRSRDTKRYK